MFCGKAVGQFLPPMVVYTSEDLYQNWVRGGPKNAVYDVTPSGQFDSRTFEICFFFLLLVPVVTGRGKVTFNWRQYLGSHFFLTKAVIDKHLEENIFFICMPPNATHLCQPLLDVAVFRAAKPEMPDIPENLKLRHMA